MTDPLTLSVLGGWAAAEGIKFLYGQAAELLKAWRERQRNPADDAALTVPIVQTEVLDGTPNGAVQNKEVLEREGAAMAKLTGTLAPYANGLLDVDLDDAELADGASRVRAILEAAYGQRFTFRGEDREPTGTRVTVKQVLGDVEGDVVGAEGDIRSGELSVDQNVETIKGSITGFKGNVGF